MTRWAHGSKREPGVAAQVIHATRCYPAAGLAAIAANFDQIPAPALNAAVEAAAKTDLLVEWVFEQGKRVLGVSTPAELFQAFSEFNTHDASPW